MGSEQTRESGRKPSKNASRFETHFRRYFDFKILSGNTEAWMRSAGSTSNASAISKNTSKEKPCAIFGASIVLIRERLTPAFSANFSCDRPRILRRAAIAIPSCMNRSRFLKDTYLPIQRPTFLMIRKLYKLQKAFSVCVRKLLL